MAASEVVRALPMLDELREGLILHFAADDRSTPHLQLGDIAVIDTADRGPDQAEVFWLKLGAEESSSDPRF
jgi:hypothetical protein